jgi:hypothetical protein
VLTQRNASTVTAICKPPQHFCSAIGCSTRLTLHMKQSARPTILAQRNASTVTETCKPPQHLRLAIGCSTQFTLHMKENARPTSLAQRNASTVNETCKPPQHFRSAIGWLPSCSAHIHISPTSSAELLSSSKLPLRKQLKPANTMLVLHCLNDNGCLMKPYFLPPRSRHQPVSDGPGPSDVLP